MLLCPLCTLPTLELQSPPKGKCQCLFIYHHEHFLLHNVYVYSKCLKSHIPRVSSSARGEAAIFNSHQRQF